MTFRHLLSALMLAGAVAVTAPQAAHAGPVTSNPVKSPFYTPNQIRYVASGGEILTIVQGNAFPVSKDVFDATVTGLMHGRPRFASPAEYTTDPSDDAKTAYWVVLVFNPPAGYDGNRACKNVVGGGAPLASGTVEVVAAFCSKSHVLGETRATLANARGLGDPDFAALIHQAQDDIFPRRPPHLGRDHRLVN